MTSVAKTLDNNELNVLGPDLNMSVEFNDVAPVISEMVADMKAKVSQTLDQAVDMGAGLKSLFEDVVKNVFQVMEVTAVKDQVQSVSPSTPMISIP